MTKTNSFHNKVIAVQTELKAPKNQFNSFGKYGTFCFGLNK